MINDIFKNKKLSQFARFVFVGGFATILHYAIYRFLQLGGLEYNLAYTLGYLISFIFNFFASNYYTFKTNPSVRRIVGFAAAHGFNYFLQIILLNVFINLGIDKGLAPFFVYSITIPTNYIFVKYVLKGDH